MHQLANFYSLGTALLILINCSALSGCDTAPPPSLAAEIPAAQTQSSNSVIRFNGICDGSAAVLLPNDNLLVAYDEHNALFEFYSNGGTVMREHDYAKALGSQPEVDVEAAVLLDQSIWWIGSHGNDGSGNQAPSRQQLFKTAVHIDAGNQSRVEVVGQGIDLLPELLRQGISAGLLNQSQTTKKPKKGGINIEGLSAMNTGELLLGLRSPLTHGDVGDALVAQVDISAAILGEQPTIVRFYSLDLDNRGIRDIQASENGYVLIAGDVDSGGEFSIYRWVPGSKPVRLLDLPKHFNAEALVDIGEHWLVMSDDGKVKRSDESAADGSRRCDSIRRKNPLAETHPSVFFRAMVLDRQTLQ